MRHPSVPARCLRFALLLWFLAALPACSASVRGSPDDVQTHAAMLRPGGPVSSEVPESPIAIPERYHPSERELHGVGMQVRRLVPTVVTRNWLDVVLLAPKGAHVRVDRRSARLAGPEFDVELRPHAPDLFAHKVQVMQRSPTTLVSNESNDTEVFQVGNSWHFLTMVQTGGQYYSCRSAPDRRFSRDQVLTMVRACWSLTSRSVASDDTVH
jgi:hypothetical protein